MIKFRRSQTSLWRYPRKELQRWAAVMPGSARRRRWDNNQLACFLLRHSHCRLLVSSARRRARRRWKPVFDGSIELIFASIMEGKHRVRWICQQQKNKIVWMWYYIIVDLLLLISTSLTYQINACATLTHVIQRKFFKKQRLGSPRGHLYYCSSSWWSKLSIMVTWRQGCWWIQFSLTFLRRNIASSFKSHKPRLTQFGWCWGRYWRIYHTTMFFRLFYPFDGTRDTSHAFLATVECRGTRFGRAVSTSFHIWDHPARKLENIQSQEVWWAQLASILSCSYWSNRVFRSSCGAVEKNIPGIDDLLYSTWSWKTLEREEST